MSILTISTTTDARQTIRQEMPRANAGARPSALAVFEPASEPDALATVLAPGRSTDRRLARSTHSNKTGKPQSLGKTRVRST